MWYIFIALFAALIAWRVLTPADLRLNRVYLKKYLHDAKGNAPRSIRVKRIPTVIPAGQPEEKLCYHIDALFADGSSQQIAAQIFYPLEALQMERDKAKKPMETDDFSPTGSLDYAPKAQSAEDIERLKEDPLKDILAEHRAADEKIARLRAEVEQLRILNTYSDFFPQLIAHDDKKNITIMDPVGAERLDDVLQTLDSSQRVSVLQSAIESLAKFHDSSSDLARQLLPGMMHNEELVRSQINGAFEGFVLAGVPLTEVEIQEILDAARGLVELGNLEVGPKLFDGSPRALFVHGSTIRPVDFGRVRKDISLIDVVELLCDPSTHLSPEQELSLFEQYAQNRQFFGDQTLLLSALLKLSVFYRLVLAGFLVKHQAALKQASKEQASSMVIKYWDESALPWTVDNLRFFLARDVELAQLNVLLEPKLEQLGKYR